MTRDKVHILLALILCWSLARAEYRIVETANPEFRPNTAFSAPEDLSAPVFARIAGRYGLSEVAAGEGNEFERILRLRRWLHGHVVKNSSPAASPHDAEAILERGPAGGEYSCGHFETAFNAVLTAAGYVSRGLLSGPDGEDPRLTGSHGSNEVWCNELCKWVLVDAEWDCHFEKDGVPLSALELREEYIRDGGAGVTRVLGPERTTAPKSRDDQWGMSPKAYAFIGWNWQVNRLTTFPDNGSSDEVVYDDEFFRGHVWHRGGRPHWAYKAGAFRRVADRGALEWTPGVVELMARIDGDSVNVQLNSDTPNLKEYQIAAEDGQWLAVEPSFTRPLSASRHEWRIRTLNTADVAGPESRLVIERQ